MAKCWNCCGLGLNAFETAGVCPNCGHEVTAASLPARFVREWKPGIGVLGDGDVEFSDLGPYRLGNSALLTYATSKPHLQAAMDRPDVVAVFVRLGSVDDLKPGERAFLITDTPQADFFKFHSYLATTSFYEAHVETYVSPDAQIDPSAQIAPHKVYIGPDAIVGANTVLLSGTVVRERSCIGPGTALGVAGARFVESEEGRIHVTHVGGVLIGEDVCIGANSVVVKSVWRQYTRIDQGAFVGNLVSIGHNCHVAPGAVILPGAVLCGSVTIEKNACIAPGAIVSDHLTVDRDAWVTLGAVVTKDVEPEQTVSGNFAIKHAKLIEHVKELAQ